MTHLFTDISWYQVTVKYLLKTVKYLLKTKSHDIYKMIKQCLFHPIVSTLVLNNSSPMMKNDHKTGTNTKKNK